MGYLTSYNAITFCLGAIWTPNPHRMCKTNSQVLRVQIQHEPGEKYARSHFYIFVMIRVYNLIIRRMLVQYLWANLLKMVVINN